jgi:hypothetical protein
MWCSGISVFLHKAHLMLLWCCSYCRSYRSPILCNHCVMYIWKLQNEICVIVKRTLSFIRIVIKTKSNKLQLFLKQITDGLNIGSKETWYPLLQIHHIALLKEGNDWNCFGPNTSLKSTGLDCAVQSTLHPGKWCAINLVTAYTEYVSAVLTVWISSVWLLGLLFLHKDSSQVMTSLLQCNSHLNCCCKTAFIIKQRSVAFRDTCQNK